MAFSVVNNIGAINAQNQLQNTNLGLNKALGRLSSGLRINSAADDASGLAIADGLRADVAALNQAVRNANDGINVVQVADGGLSEISNLLQRAVALSEQAASDTSGADNSASKQALSSEYESILQEINRISLTLEFNDQVIFGDVSGLSFDIQVGTTGTAANDVITLTTDALTATASGAAGLALTGTGTGPAVTSTALDTKAGAVAELALVTAAIDNVAARRGNPGAVVNRLESTVAVISTQSQNLQAAESQIRDADIAAEITNLTKFQVLQQTGLASLAQANISVQGVLSLL